MKHEEHLYYSSAVIAKLNFKVFGTAKGIKKVLINNKPAVHDFTDEIKLRNDDPFLFGIFDELDEYFNKGRKEFSVPLDIQGTEFQKKVWKELKKIPFGQTKTYKQIAEKIKNPKALRAVGGAIGANPVPIIIPCHRVLNTNGSLGGFSCGLEVKELLLELEGSLCMELF